MEFQVASARLMQEEWKLSIPIGIKFRPNDVELIGYLFRKVSQLPIYPGIIAEANVYDYDPTNLRDISFDHGDGVFYFFTPTFRRYSGGNRTNRKAGKGYWKANGSEQPIKDSYNKVVGSKRMLAFFNGKPCDKDAKNSKTKWIMYEYKVPTDISPSIHYNEGIQMLDTMVLCKIYYKREPMVHQRQQEGEQQQQQQQQEEEEQQQWVQSESSMQPFPQPQQRVPPHPPVRPSVPPPPPQQQHQSCWGQSQSWMQPYPAQPLQSVWAQSLMQPPPPPQQQQKQWMWPQSLVQPFPAALPPEQQHCTQSESSEQPFAPALPQESQVQPVPPQPSRQQQSAELQSSFQQCAPPPEKRRKQQQQQNTVTSRSEEKGRGLQHCHLASQQSNKASSSFSRPWRLMLQVPAPSMALLPPNSELNNDNFLSYCEQLSPLLPLQA